MRIVIFKIKNDQDRKDYEKYIKLLKKDEKIISTDEKDGIVTIKLK
jgi:hypothetical protein